MPPVRFLGHLAHSLLSVAWRRLRGRRTRPSWSLGFEVLVDALRRNTAFVATLEPERARRYQARLGLPFKHPVSRAPSQLGGVPVEWFRPREDHADRPVIVYLHGGSYIFGSTDSYAELLGRLALAARADVLGVDYRLAPEHTLKEATDDVVSVYQALLEAGRSPETIAFAGDSAGGSLALLGLLAIRDGGSPRPACAALVAPWVDLRCESPSWRENSGVDWGTRAGLRAQAALVSRGEPLDRPDISPILADLSGLPPVLIHCGDAEMLRDDSVALAERLTAQGVEAKCKVWPDMVHNFQMFVGYTPLAERAVEELAAFVRSQAGDGRHSGAGRSK